VYVVLVLAVVITSGFGVFWPHRLVSLQLKDGTKALGEMIKSETRPGEGNRQRIQLKVGNRDLLGADFEWVNDADIVNREEPSGAWFVERREYGPFLGFPVRLVEGDKELASSPEAVAALLRERLARAAADRIIDAVLGEIEAGIEGRRKDAE